MAKNLPILRRLEIALSETSSASEKNKVYALLYQLGQNLDWKNLDREKFYEKIDHKTLSIIENPNTTPTPDNISKGKTLGKHLTEHLEIPTKEQEPRGYGRKIKSLLEQEFNIIKQYFS